MANGVAFGDTTFGGIFNGVISGWNSYWGAQQNSGGSLNYPTGGGAVIAPPVDQGNNTIIGTGGYQEAGVFSSVGSWAPWVLVGIAAIFLLKTLFSGGKKSRKYYY